MGDTVASRRSFLLGAGTFLAAPAIVRVASLMPVSVPERLRIVRRWLPFGATVNGALVGQVGYAGTMWWTAVMYECAGWSQMAAGDGKFIWTRIDPIAIPSTSFRGAL